MKYIQLERISTDTKDFQDGEVFVAYRNKDNYWCFAMRINGVYTLSKMQSPKCGKAGVLKAKKQILFCKHYGWSYSGQKSLNFEVDEEEHQFICLYCRNMTFNTSDPCPCRGKTKYDFMKKTENGFILPF